LFLSLAGVRFYESSSPLRKAKSYSLAEAADASNVFSRSYFVTARFELPMRPLPKWCGVMVLFAGVTLFAGCGGGTPGVPAKGKLVLAGQAFDPSAYDPITIILYPDTTSGTAENTFPAIVEDDGTFTVPGREGQGIPPGKYHVSIETMSHPDRKHLRLPADVRGPASRVSCEVGKDQTEIATIDLAKP
jgi:hypothetical protein